MTSSQLKSYSLRSRELHGEKHETLFIYLFIHFWLCWIFLAVHRFSLAADSEGYSSLWCTGFSLQITGAWTLGVVAVVSVQFSPVQSLSRVWLFATPWIAALQASLSITNSQSLLKLMSIELVMPSNHLILCYFLLLLPSIPIMVFSNESTLHIRWPKYWSCFSISPSNSCPQTFRIFLDQGLIPCSLHCQMDS